MTTETFPDTPVNPPSVTISPLENTPKAAAVLGISPAYLRKLVKNGDGPSFTLIGRSPYFAREDLASWLAARRHAAKRTA